MLITGCDTGIGQHILILFIIYCHHAVLGHEVARHLDSLGCLVFAGCQVSDNDPDPDSDNDNDPDPDNHNDNVRTQPRRAPRGCGWGPVPGCSW